MIKASFKDEIHLWMASGFFGDAMILTPTEKRVRLKIRIVCSSRSCHCFVFCKSDYNTLRDAYSLVAQAIDEQLDPSYIKRWIR